MISSYKESEDIVKKKMAEIGLLYKNQGVSDKLIRENNLLYDFFISKLSADKEVIERFNSVFDIGFVYYDGLVDYREKEFMLRSEMQVFVSKIGNVFTTLFDNRIVNPFPDATTGTIEFISNDTYIQSQEIKRATVIEGLELCGYKYLPNFSILERSIGSLKIKGLRIPGKKAYDSIYSVFFGG